ncbi:MAG TPA: hypothetical protein VMT30_04940 [Candidatus Saccharimonadia bacterium]|nr:hypothetical protein [Candidatus Saccharimonadia bacterium]
MPIEACVAKNLLGGRYVRYLRIGTGDQLVVHLHGLGGIPGLDLGWLAWLSQELNLTVLAPFLPNHARSCRVDTYDELIDCLGDWAESCGIERALWIGHSLGGYLVYGVALKRPQYVGGVVNLAGPVNAVFDRRPIPLLMPKLAYLAVEGLIAFWVSLGTQLLGPYRRDVLRHTVDSVLHGPRARTILRLIRNTPQLLGPMQRLPIPAFNLGAGLDPTIRYRYPWPGPGGPGDMVTLFGAPHNFPSLLPLVPHFRAAIIAAVSTVLTGMVNANDPAPSTTRPPVA